MLPSDKSLVYYLSPWRAAKLSKLLRTARASLGYLETITLLFQFLLSLALFYRIEERGVAAPPRLVHSWFPTESFRWERRSGWGRAKFKDCG